MQLHGSLSAGDDLSVIRTLLVGGGELHPSLAERVAGIAAGQGGSVPRVFESFGMTETYTHVALRRINGPEPEEAFRLMEGVKARQDDRGCLVVEVPGVTTGEVVTNDLVEIDQSVPGFRWLGRYDNLISTGGIKVLPEILEARIGSLLGADCLVLPRPDEKLGQRLVLLVEWPGEPAPVGHWKSMFRQQLALHEIPKQVITVPGLPRNASFKPDRQAAMKQVFTDN
jgi:O-succinylbenzoic acid--CoA ligase